MKNLVKRIYKKIARKVFGRESFGLAELDLKILPYLNNKEGGFFIEAGANDGITQSNTLLLERKFKWKGLLVEPIPELASKCKTNRPDCIVENKALVPFGFDGTEVEMRYSNLMSLVKGAMPTEEAELEHIKQGCEVQHIETYDIKVPATTLTDLLDKHKIKDIDLLSLDVEGFELSVLKGIDFNRYRPKFILVEARFREEILEFLKDIYTPIAEPGYYDILFKLKN